MEIGAGAGALTLELAPRVRTLVAIELDRNLVERLARQAPRNVQVVCDDFLKVDLEPWLAEGPLRVAGNLPYSASAPILLRLLTLSGSGSVVRDATVMLQREVADRLLARPGSRDYGALSVSVQLHADVGRLLAVPAGAFRPPPRITSALVRLRFRAPTVSLPDPARFEALVRGLFQHRRKTLLNAVKPVLRSRGASPAEVLVRAALDGARRPETLSVAELAALDRACFG